MYVPTEEQVKLAEAAANAETVYAAAMRRWVKSPPSTRLPKSLRSDLKLGEYRLNTARLQLYEGCEWIPEQIEAAFASYYARIYNRAYPE